MSIFLCAVVVLSCFSYLLGTTDRFKCVHCDICCCTIEDNRISK